MLKISVRRAPSERSDAAPVGRKDELSRIADGSELDHIREASVDGFHRWEFRGVLSSRQSAKLEEGGAILPSPPTSEDKTLSAWGKVKVDGKGCPEGIAGDFALTTVDHAGNRIVCSRCYRKIGFEEAREACRQRVRLVGLRPGLRPLDRREVEPFP